MPGGKKKTPLRFHFSLSYKVGSSSKNVSSTCLCFCSLIWPFHRWDVAISTNDFRDIFQVLGVNEWLKKKSPAVFFQKGSAIISQEWCEREWLPLSVGSYCRQQPFEKDLKLCWNIIGKKLSACTDNSLILVHFHPWCKRWLKRLIFFRHMNEKRPFDVRAGVRERLWPS